MIRIVSKLAVAVALSVAVPSAASAQWDLFTPLTRYTLSGCWEGISCHTMTFTVARVTPPAGRDITPFVPGGWQPGDHSVGWALSHTTQAVPGTTLTVTGPNPRGPYPYSWVGFGGYGIKGNSWGSLEYFWSNGACLGSLYFRDAGSASCSEQYDYQWFGGTVRDGWTPGDLTFHVFRSDKAGFMCPPHLAGECPATWAVPTDSAVVTLRLTNTEDLSTTTTPEPGTNALLATGLALLAVPALRRRRG
jgi:hypothetical protein